MGRGVIIEFMVVVIMLANLGTVFFDNATVKGNKALSILFKHPSLSQEGIGCLSVVQDSAEILVDPKDNVFYSWEKRSNDSITINVTVANITGLFGLLFKMHFNSSLIRCTDFGENLFHTVTPQSSWGNIWQITRKIDNTNGYIEYAYTYVDTNRASSEGYAPINITTPEYPQGKLATAILTFSITMMPPPNGYVGCPLHLTSVQPTDASGNVLLWDLVDGYYKLTSPNGDLNDDGMVDIYDAILFAQTFGSVPTNSSWNARADMNSDDIIDIFDALVLATNFGKPAVVR